MGDTLKSLLAVFGLAMALAGPAAAQECRVLDPELQGRYEGDCREGLAHGSGFASGTAEYRGEFVQGAKHGRGVKTWPSGDRYEGEFVNDRKHGQGRYSWGGRGPSAGDSYAGSFNADQRHGRGTYTWATGEKYSGRWENDRPAEPLPAALLDRVRAQKDQELAASRPGVQVCRELRVGIAERDWVRATVLASEPGSVELRIDDPGRYQHVLDGVTLVKGTVLRQAPVNWTPCG